MKIDLRAILERLFEDEVVRKRLVRDYDLGSVESPDELGKGLLEQLNQAAVPRPLERALDDRVVYRAAVNAIASNSRAWTMVVRNRAALERALHGYDLTRPPDESELAALLPGQSGPADARAIRCWCSLLSSRPDYYSDLVAVGRGLADCLASEAELVPCVAILIGSPRSAARMDSSLAATYRSRPREDWKAPGMGPVLASEFLRNLGWSGFKPDRHVVRLLGRWAPEVVAAQAERAGELGRLLGTRSKLLLEFLQCSLAGAALTPPEATYSAVDNLVWTLGAYAEKKHHESERSYLRAT